MTLSNVSLPRKLNSYKPNIMNASLESPLLLPSKLIVTPLNQISVSTTTHSHQVNILIQTFYQTVGKNIFHHQIFFGTERKKRSDLVIWRMVRDLSMQSKTIVRSLCLFGMAGFGDLGGDTLVVTIRVKWVFTLVRLSLSDSCMKITLVFKEYHKTVILSEKHMMTFKISFASIQGTHSVEISTVSMNFYILLYMLD